jgi:hypothetical protein
MAGEAETGRRLPSWLELLGQLVPLLGVAAILLYGYLAVCYDRFYGSLGVDPNDVGLSYSTTLARSPALVVGFVAASMIVWPMAAQRLLVDLRAVPRGGPDRPDKSQIVTTMIPIAFIVFLVIWVPLQAGLAANDVKVGKAVRPIRFPVTQIPAFAVLAVRASPAVVEPAAKAGDLPAVERLHGRSLLYLGQANGTVVLYDPSNDAEQVVYLPASSIVLRVSNCEADRSPDPACKRLDRTP